jgi:DNA-binding transcriptional LysR family regulator
MDLHHLRYLLALAEHQSFRKAAEALCLTQPALSHSLQALEQELGVTLIDRLGKRNNLTAYGSQVVQSARRVLMETAELRRSLAQLKDGALGKISVGFGPTPAAILMTPFLRQMAAVYPRVQVNVSRGSVDLLTQALRSEKVDIIAVDLRALAAFPDLKVELLPPLRGGFLCRAGHPLLDHASIDLSMLRNHPVTSTPLSEEISRNLVLELGADAHPERLMTINSEDIPSLLDIVETTEAVFFGMFRCAKSRIEVGQMRELQVLPHVERLGRYALVSLAGRSELPIINVFRNFARVQFDE